MLCDTCGKGGATIRLMTRSYGKGPTLLVIEDVSCRCLSPLWRELLDRRDLA